MSTEDEIKAFYERVKALCKEKGISQIELCESCEINLQSHRGRISKNVAPDVFDACKIAAFLNTTVEYLVTGEEKDPLADENSMRKNKIQKAREILS